MQFQALRVLLFISLGEKGYTVYSNNTNESKYYSCPTGFDRKQLFLKGTFFLGLWDSEQLVICMLNM